MCTRQRSAKRNRARMHIAYKNVLAPKTNPTTRRAVQRAADDAEQDQEKPDPAFKGDPVVSIALVPLEERGVCDSSSMATRHATTIQRLPE